MSVFTKIINGELPCYKIYEDQQTFAFLALDQINLGHSLVIPKQEIDHWLNVEPDLLAKVQIVAQRIGKAIQKSTSCPRVLTAAVGFEVPHYHLHLIPAWAIADLNFAKASRRSDQEMREIQQKIVTALNG